MVPLSSFGSEGNSALGIIFGSDKNVEIPHWRRCPRIYLRVCGSPAARLDSRVLPPSPESIPRRFASQELERPALLGEILFYLEFKVTVFVFAQVCLTGRGRCAWIGRQVERPRPLPGRSGRRKLSKHILRSLRVHFRHLSFPYSSGCSPTRARK